MLPDINLLPKYERERSFLYILFLIGLLLALLLSGFMIYQFISVKSELNEVNLKNERLTTTKENLELQMAKKEAVSTESMEIAVKYAETYVVPTSKLIHQLMTFLPPAGYLSKYNYREGEVAVETHFETMTEASTYVAKLDASDYVRDVKVNRVETFELEEPQASTDEATEDGPTPKDLFEVLPRYQVTYSFHVDQDELLKENEENE